MTTWIGSRVQRVEDRPLLLGAASFTGDRLPANCLYARFVRSTVASGTIAAVATSLAALVDGVVAVLTADDLDAAPLDAVLDRPGFVRRLTPILAKDRVRYVGEPLAIVIATDPYVAEDAAELVEPLIVAERPLIDIDDGEVLLDTTYADDPGIDAVLTACDLVIEAEFRSARLNAVPLEGRAVLAEWNRGERRLTLHSSTQVPHLVRTTVADSLGLGEQQVRVIAPDVGGGFGQKAVVAREEVAIAAAARQLRRSVLWEEDRAEGLISGAAARDQRYRVRAGFTRDGRLIALDADIICDVGAYHCYPFTAGVEALMAAGELTGPYTVQRYRCHTRAVATNKAPMAPFRGVSRPQIALVTERLLDKAARRLNIDRAEIRLRNLPTDLPYQTVTGLTLDPASYRESLADIAAHVGLDGWAQRQADARRAGHLLGLGVSVIAERSAYGTPVFAARDMAITPGFEVAHVRMDPSGGVTVLSGTSGHGQGHRTTLAQIVADQVGVPFDQVRVVQGDTDVVQFGWGTFASRSVAIGGGAAKLAAVGLAEQLKRIAANQLEAAEADIVLEDGSAHVAGVPSRAVAISELARSAHHSAHLLPDGQEPGLEAKGTSDGPGAFSNAAHAALVDVDEATGEVKVLRYAVVEDCGVVINPAVVDGQVRGGVAQGIAAALFEALPYDAAGQPLATSLMDYLVPTASEIPRIDVSHLCTPCETTETGSKGMGEGGTIGAVATVACAVADAVAHLGIEVDHVPITPAWLSEQIIAAHAADRSGTNEDGQNRGT